MSDSARLLAYLQERGIAAFTVDVVSNDSYIGSPAEPHRAHLDQVEHQNGGIMLFHDIKASTANALPTILGELKKRGYKIVLMRPKTTFTPLPALTAELEAKRAKVAEKRAAKENAGAVLRGGAADHARYRQHTRRHRARAQRARAHACGRHARDREHAGTGYG